MMATLRWTSPQHWLVLNRSWGGYLVQGGKSTPKGVSLRWECAHRHDYARGRSNTSCFQRSKMEARSSKRPRIWEAASQPNSSPPNEYFLERHGCERCGWPCVSRETSASRFSDRQAASHPPERVGLSCVLRGATVAISSDVLEENSTRVSAIGSKAGHVDGPRTGHGGT